MPSLLRGMCSTAVLQLQQTIFFVSGGKFFVWNQVGLWFAQLEKKSQICIFAEMWSITITLQTSPTLLGYNVSFQFYLTMSLTICSCYYKGMQAGPLWRSNGRQTWLRTKRLVSVASISQHFSKELNDVKLLGVSSLMARKNSGTFTYFSKTLWLVASQY